MNNFNYRRNCCNSINDYNDNRFLGGGFLFPFLAGAAISAPFWYLGANKNQQQVYYQPQPYPIYYPYQTVDPYQQLYPYSAYSTYH